MGRTSTHVDRGRTSPAEAPADMAALLDAFARLEVVVVGDAMLDAYLEGTADRLSREAPVPVVRVGQRIEAAGGAANVAVNLASLGARVALVSVVGCDDAGDELLDLLDRAGVDVTAVPRARERATLTKRRILAAGQMLVRVDDGTLEPLARPLEAEVADQLRGAARRADAVVVADYGAGVMTNRVIAALASAGRRACAPVVVDAKDPRRYRRLRPTACTPNFAEATRALGGAAPVDHADRARAISATGQRLLELSGALIAAVTLDRDGAVLLERGRPAHRVYTHDVHERCGTGAGDTFTATFALGLAAGGDPATAAELAVAAATVVVSKPATATCSPAELRLWLLPGAKLLPDASRLAIQAERHRREGRRIVFTNGCFDILHRGHVTLLNRAKELGDVLVVAVNGDASVRRLKGPGRPINSLVDRTEVLASLSCVDHVVAFDDDRPEELLRALRPDVVVKGGDYAPDTLPEAPLVRALGAELRILDLMPERSTTRIVERLRSVGS